MSRGKGKDTLALVEAAARILEEIQPATVRAVCYRLFAEGVIENMSKANTGKVSRQLVWAREQGIISWAWIVDETREAERVNSWDDPEQLLQAAGRQYRKDYWADQPNRVEVWSEKGTVRGTLAPILNEYGVTFRVMHGFGSATAIYEAAQDTLGDKPFTVLYVGDFDPSGMYMSEKDLPQRLNRYGGQAHLHRVALVERDLDGLSGFDASTKRGDTRHDWYIERHGSRCWELDAMSPVDLRNRVASEITVMVDTTKWSRCIEVEGVEQKSVAEFLTTWSKFRQDAICSGGAS